MRVSYFSDVSSEKGSGYVISCVEINCVQICHETKVKDFHMNSSANYRSV